MTATVVLPFVAGLVVSAAPAFGQDRDRPDPTSGTTPQFKTASEMYWDAVRATTGPIGFPQAVPDDELAVRSRALPRRFNPAFFASIPYIAPPPAPMYVPVYVPVYVPGPVVYVPLPTAPTQNNATASITSAPRRPEKIYVIPGCYGGNRPPDPKALPAGCDIKKLRVSTW